MVKAGLRRRGLKGKPLDVEKSSEVLTRPVGEHNAKIRTRSSETGA